ncbi:LytTR family DNA-binding domain-containing protein [Aquisalinus flavus]|uniref:LytTr DNA-binding domain protein n=1 Tax=Aquisalinus flavus TaxID=1526572 RepID=A0A8J2V289_9PROT|nr:LytTR family DNA-binding domain-containing protein [Aquisalinus flavus]MBD0425324.1 LytTR family transcriptional regulator [Aquisalinus flavus]GGD16987.1 LytTr DNA-binding domain protein [Aquisalinus flavus]
MQEPQAATQGTSGARKSTFTLSIDRAILLDIAIAAGAIAFLTYLGPFGTKAQLTLLPRLIYWAFAVGAGYAGAGLHDRFVRPMVIRRLGRIAGAVMKIIPVTLSAMACVIVLEIIFREPIPAWALLSAATRVLVIALAISGVASLGNLRNRATAAPNDAPCPRLSSFREKLPAGLRRAAIHAIAAEDHYIRVFTGAGDALIAGRFADAMDAVRTLKGSRTHRSWWAADEAVEALEKNAGRWQLKLAGGITVPVSRNYRADIRARGWDRRG